jgi:hypothetical protein
MTNTKTTTMTRFKRTLAVVCDEIFLSLLLGIWLWIKLKLRIGLGVGLDMVLPSMSFNGSEDKKSQKFFPT